MPPQNPKVTAAFEAMKELGIPQKKVKPVLKDLLQTYDKNWRMIEQENYRVLVDAIFDAEDNATEKKKRLVKRVNETTEEEPEEETERPLKRIRSRGREVSQSPNTAESPESREEGRQVSLSPPKRNKGKQPMVVAKESLAPIGPPVTGRGLMIYERRSHKCLSLMDPVTEAGKVLTIDKVTDTSPLAEPKDEPFSDDTFIHDIPEYTVPISVIHPAPERENDIPAENGETGGCSTSGEMRRDCEARREQVEPCSNLVIATSPLGEVKLSLSCNSAVGKRKFLAPTLDAVVKTAEEKCISSYKISDPNFSVSKLLTHICESFLELGTECLHESQDGPSTEQPSDSVHEPQDGPSTQKPSDSIHEPHDGPSTEQPSDSVHEPQDGPSTEQPSDFIHEPRDGPANNQASDSHDIVEDITNGEESNMIPRINEINRKCPELFRYISKGLVFQNAKLDVSLSGIGDKNCCSSCFGDCLSAPVPCACAQGSGGEFAYTVEGLVKEDFLEKCISITRDQCPIFCEECPLEKSKNDGCLEPCKGHLKMKFIKECWEKCGCNKKKCGNRIVQRGITRSLQVFFTSEERGWGLRTLEELPKGTFVCEFVGEILTATECHERTVKCGEGGGNTYLALLDADWGYKGSLKDEKALCLDASQYGNAARFINHRCLDANLVEIPVEVETPDHHYYHVAFFATRKVDAMEELTRDYGIDFDDEDHPIKPFVCRCGSKFCRNIKRVNRPKSTPTSS